MFSIYFFYNNKNFKKVFSKSKKNRTIPSTKTTLYAPISNLNNQQTLVYDESFLNDSLYNRRVKSAVDLNRSEYFDNKRLISSSNPYATANLTEMDFAKSIRDKHFYGDKSKRTLTKSSNKKSFETLPISKTLVHEKPWSYGKVECNYYPYRDSKIQHRYKSKNS